MSFLAFSGLLNGITALSLGVFVLRKNWRSTQNRTYFNLNLSVAIFSFGYFLWQLARSADVAIFWFRILTVGIILINVAYLHFVFAFVGILEKRKKLLGACYFVNFIFLILNAFTLLYTRLIPKHGFGFWPVPTLLFHIYLSWWVWQCSYGFCWLVKGYRLSTGLKREQIGYFIIAAIIGFVGGATNWPLWYDIPLPPHPNILITLYIAIVAYAILRRYFLEDLQAVQARLIEREKWATLGRLATSTKHEVDNPLYILMLNLGDLLTRLEDEEQKNQPLKNFRKQLEIINRQAERVATVTKTIYDLPKKVKEEMVPLKLDEIIDKSFNLARFQTYWESLSETKVIKDWPAELPQLRGDIVHLQGMFLNLITNAYQAMQKSKPKERKITIKARVDLKDKDFVEIVFSDNGPGIPKEHMDKLFDFNFTTKGKKLGVGLFICKYVVETIHGGTIQADSQLGQGATFTIRLPIWKEG